MFNVYIVRTRARSSKSAGLNEKRFFFFVPLLRGPRTNNNLTSRTDSRAETVSAVEVMEVGSVCGEVWGRRGVGLVKKKCEKFDAICSGGRHRC